MGLITGLLRQVLSEAEREYYDPVRIRQQLEAVDKQRQDGTLSDAEATAWEDELIERLMEGRARTREE